MSSPIAIVRLPLVILPLVIAGCDTASPPAPQAKVEVPVTAGTAGGAAKTKGRFDTSQRGKAMPTEGFTDPAGKRVTLAMFQGQPLLVNLWATWCAPCVKEMPALDRLAARTKGKLRVLVVNQDSNTQATDPVAAWWAKASLANLQAYRDAKNDLGFAYGGGLPVTVLYDAVGKEVWRVNGEVDWDSAVADEMLGTATIKS